MYACVCVYMCVSAAQQGNANAHTDASYKASRP